MKKQLLSHDAVRGTVRRSFDYKRKSSNSSCRIFATAKPALCIGAVIYVGAVIYNVTGYPFRL